MRPLDPRLIARIGPARRYVFVTAALGVLTALLILLQALVIARLLAPVLSPTPLPSNDTAADGLGWLGHLVPVGVRELPVGLTWLVCIVALRTGVMWLQERQAHRAGTRVVSELRLAVVTHAATLGLRWSASGRAADVTTLVTRGLDNLLPYFVRYLPQLFLAATVTPIMVVVVLGLDVTSAVIVLVTLPLVPVFMILIGRLTQSRSATHLVAMQRLGSQTLDLISGIPTLRGLGRARGPAARVRELGEAHRRATMASLRVAFLSGMVLELLTTLAVALVAVSMGFRLADGGIGIETALAVLVLAPEVYLPIRNVGTHFHASADGMAAADAAFSFLDERTDTRPRTGPAPTLVGTPVSLNEFGVLAADGRMAPKSLSFEAIPGRLTVLVGPNGEGKSTALAALAGLVVPDAGAVLSGDVTLGSPDTAVDDDSWAHQCAWVPQRPDLGPSGPLAEPWAATADRAQSRLRVRPSRVAAGRTDRAPRPRGTREVIAAIVAAAAAGRTVVVTTHETELRDAADVLVEVRA